ncbi:MAG: hypothetical protein JWP34_5422, partial [Massilia sp.]|nr:hypothetical protein [Massilia sp.]
DHDDTTYDAVEYLATILRAAGSFVALQTTGQSPLFSFLTDGCWLGFLHERVSHLFRKAAIQTGPGAAYTGSKI